jgi:predicted 2-oxoglutarate/Fe(II)-dependent dioxygenase YbiX
MIKNDICIFPSMLPHRVNPVTKGKRRALVGWIKGPAWI